MTPILRHFSFRDARHRLVLFLALVGMAAMASAIPLRAQSAAAPGGGSGGESTPDPMEEQNQELLNMGLEDKNVIEVFPSTEKCEVCEAILPQLGFLAGTFRMVVVWWVLLYVVMYGISMALGTSGPQELGRMFFGIAIVMGAWLFSFFFTEALKPFTE